MFEKTPGNNEKSNKDENYIPSQYKGLSSEVVEELWDSKKYVDPEKTESENIRREKAIRQIKDQEAANKIREKLGISTKETQKENSTLLEQNKKNYEGISEKDYEEFRLKSGETDVGVYWHEYGNVAAKKLKESGKLEWGKERIYFDIPLDDMEELRDLSFELAKSEKIPIAFKHLDTKKTYPIDLKQDSETTRFVANFASIEDAKRFYQVLQQKEGYKKMKSDRGLDYHGYNLDGVAHYASGYREGREPLKRIIETAQKNPDNTYSYYSKDGTKKITITEEAYKNFTNKYKAMPDSEDVWKKTNV